MAEGYINEVTQNQIKELQAEIESLKNELASAESSITSLQTKLSNKKMIWENLASSSTTLGGVAVVDVTETSTVVNTLSARKFSDYDYILFLPMANSSYRQPIIVPSYAFTISAMYCSFYAGGKATNYVAIRWKSDISYQIECNSDFLSLGNPRIALLGLKMSD